MTLPSTPPSDVRIANLPLKQLIAADSNANVMTEAEVKALKDGVGALGFLQPLLVRPLKGKAFRYEIIDGHHRAEAAKSLGMEEVPCVVVSDMSEEQVHITRIAMNKNRGELDLTVVGQQLRDMVAEFELDVSELTLTGYTESEVQDLLRSSDDIDAGAAELSMEMPAEMDSEPETTSDAETLLFSLELHFKDRETLKMVKRKLKKASGKAKDPAEGLLRLLGEEK